MITNPPQAASRRPGQTGLAYGPAQLLVGSSIAADRATLVLPALGTTRVEASGICFAKQVRQVQEYADVSCGRTKLSRLFLAQLAAVRRMTEIEGAAGQTAVLPQRNL